MQNAGVKTLTIRRTVARLAQYRPFGSGEPQVELARRALIVAAARENGGSFTSLADCQASCETLWGLRLDIDELRVAIESLVALGIFCSDGGAFSLSKAESASLDERIDIEAETERRALLEWEIRVKALFTELTPVEVDDLKSDLVSWVQRMIVGHGVEAALVVYPEHDRSSEFVEALAGFGFDNLPRRDPRIEVIRRQAIHLFVSEPTAAQRDYLLNLLNTAYMLAVYTIDPAASELVKGITRGQRVYLDTNVVYSILNLAGPRSYMTARRILDLTRELGYEVAVTPWTVREMKSSVKLAREKLSKTTLPPQALAELAADACSDESFVTAYWRKFKETGVSADDFLDFHEQIETKLVEAGISVIDNGCLAVDRDEDGIAEQLGLISTIPGGSAKSVRVQEHDIKHRLLVERLRGVAVRRFSNAGYWFLTRDSVLIPYASERKPESDSLPFAMSLQAWANVVRSLSPKTDDFEQTLVDLMDTDSARGVGSVSLSTVSQVLGRVHLLIEDSSEEVATRMLIDAAAMSRIELIPDDSREAAIDAVVEQKSNELAEQLEELQKVAARERANNENAALVLHRTKDQLNFTKNELAAAVDRVEFVQLESDAARSDAAQRILSLEDDLRRMEGDREEDERENAKKFDDLSTELTEVREEHRAHAERRSRSFRAAAVFSLVGLAAISCTLPLVVSGLTSGLPLAVTLTASVLFLIGAVGIALGWTRAGIVATVIALAIGLLSGIIELINAAKPGA